MFLCLLFAKMPGYVHEIKLLLLTKFKQLVLSVFWICIYKRLSSRVKRQHQLFHPMLKYVYFQWQRFWWLQDLDMGDTCFSVKISWFLFCILLFRGGLQTSPVLWSSSYPDRRSSEWSNKVSFSFVYLISYNGFLYFGLSGCKAQHC